jgi:hypothetical protein
MRELTVEGHLAALESGTDAATRAGRLALATAARSLAMAAAFATAHALAAMDGTRDVLEFVKFHRIPSWVAAPNKGVGATRSEKNDAVT